MAAKRIIVLETIPSDGGFQNVRTALWFPMTSPIPNPNFESAWPGRSQAEIDALRSGTVREEQRTFTFPVGMTGAQIKNALESDWTARNTWISTQSPPGQFYGLFFDGTTWSA